MSDLISRSEVLELLYKIFNKYHMSTDKNTSIGKSFGTDVFKEIKEMPIAYNVDKVIEELNKHKDTTDLTTVDEEMVVGFTIYQGAFNDAIDKAIEIVKQGSDADCNVVDMHLCDTCKKTYPECDGKNVKFGCDIDTYPNTRQNKDNIFYCDGYVKR